jgi:hypothetical protein
MRRSDHRIEYDTHPAILDAVRNLYHASFPFHHRLRQKSFSGDSTLKKLASFHRLTGVRDAGEVGEAGDVGDV